MWILFMCWMQHFLSINSPILHCTFLHIAFSFNCRFILHQTLCHLWYPSCFIMFSDSWWLPSRWCLSFILSAASWKHNLKDNVVFYPPVVPRHPPSGALIGQDAKKQSADWTVEKSSNHKQEKYVTSPLKEIKNLGCFCTDVFPTTFIQISLLLAQAFFDLLLMLVIFLQFHCLFHSFGWFQGGGGGGIILKTGGLL